MTITLKTRATQAILSAIAGLHLAKLLPSLAGRGVIFTLHHVRPRRQRAFEPNAHLEITPEFLEEAIVTAKSAGLTPVRLEDLPTLLAEDDPSKRYVCFTLDDGYRNNAEFAAPIFRKYNVPYTIFICPGFVTRTRTMWWETITEVLQSTNSIQFDFGNGLEVCDTTSLQSKLTVFHRITKRIGEADENHVVEQIDALALAHNFEAMSIVRQETMDEHELAALAADPLCTLGGHTLTHCNLARVTANRLQDEIETSCHLVASYAQKPVTTFAYPYGWKHAAGTREFAAAHELGLKAAVTTRPGTLQSDTIHQMTALKRVSLNGHFQKPRYVQALISGLPFKLLK